MNREEENKTIDAEKWFDLVSKGVNAEIVTVPRGTSMWPLIGNGTDEVVIRPIKDELQIGDIVLFKRKDGKSVLHRVYKISKDRQIIQTYGDNCSKPDAPVSIDKVLGVAEEIKKGDLTIKTLRAREVKGAAIGKTLRMINKPIRLAKKAVHWGYDRARSKDSRSTGQDHN